MNQMQYQLSSNSEFRNVLSRTFKLGACGIGIGDI